MFSDPVQFVAYFRAGQALHYFPVLLRLAAKPGLGWPQSLGSAGRKAWAA